MIDNDDTVVIELRDLCLRLSELLWSIHSADGSGSRLIPPRKRDAAIRVSEQESRILLCQLLEKSRFFYSVETPTIETYQQTGATPISGRSDLSLYTSRSHDSKLVNVELKAFNIGYESLRKDFEKMLREDIHALWFHTLESADHRTFPNLFGKVKDAFSLLQNELDGRTHSIVFAFCVLSRNETWVNTIMLSGSASDQLQRVHNVFDSAHLREPETGGWVIHRMAAGQQRC